MCEPMMSEPDGLGPLEMGIAWQHGIDVLAGAFEQDTAKGEQTTLSRERDVAEKERQVGGDLIISGAAGVELAGDGTEVRPQPGLDVHVDVFERWIEGKAALLDLARNLIEPCHERVGLI